MKGLPIVPAYITLAALAALLAVNADTERARNNEANNACEIHGALGADKQACFNAYLCTNYGDCDGEDMQPIAPLPGGGVYRDDNGGANNG